MNDSEWCILCLKGHGTQKASVKTHLTVKDELETDLFGSVPPKKLLWIRSWPTSIAVISETKERKYT